MTITTDLELEALTGQVHAALANWNNLSSSEEELLSGLLLVRQRRQAADNATSPLQKRRLTNEVLQEAIDRLAAQSQRDADVLRWRFAEEQIIRQVATRLHASPDQINRWQRAAIHHLAEILYSRETSLRDARRRQLEDALPPPSYTLLVGIAAARQKLLRLLSEASAPWQVAVWGLGGIGKTALADAVCRDLCGAFIYEGIVWFRAAGQTLSGKPLNDREVYEALLNHMADTLWPEAAGGQTPAQRAARAARLLRERPYLLVVDNLETTENTSYLLEQTSDLVKPSKIVLTTRARPTIVDQAYFLPLHSLSQADAVTLMRHQARTGGLTELANARESVLVSVYDAVGGNPLALKLVVSLAAVMPLDQILEGLAGKRTGAIDNLYRHVFWHSWRALSPEAQTLLQAMPLIGQAGALPEQMQAISQLPDDSFWNALTELVSRSLLEVHGSVETRRYGIHRLTEAFLHSEIIDWPPDNS
ncbi:MAG: NB-ARC domain-containing protein [Candidatus Promineifilaceae bacterium]|nr:NB-ARC domain-containing protein [Candidatus Promineifilaceae bacterium]